ncbi:MAG: hypothetical protein ACFCUG_07230 [Thiotrichales bacterium]
MKKITFMQSLAAMTCALALATAPAWAEPPHRSGGIGLEERAEFARDARNYNLHLEFARARDGAYFSDVDLRIRNRAGKTVLTLDHAGPLVQVQLPAGTYRVEGLRNDVRKQATVQVGKGTKRAILSWAD